MYSKIVIGIDQSYECTGVSIIADGKLMNAVGIDTKKLNKTQCRNMVKERLDKLLYNIEGKSKEIIIIIEHIRMFSQGFISMPYIINTGALIAVIIDIAYEHNIPVYSVDTRSWKSQVVGTSKPKNNKYGFDPKKWPTIQWCVNKGYEDLIKQEVSKQKKKAVIESGGIRYTLNDNIADSICIGMYGFIPKQQQKLSEEK